MKKVNGKQEEYRNAAYVVRFLKTDTFVHNTLVNVYNFKVNTFKIVKMYYFINKSCIRF